MKHTRLVFGAILAAALAVVLIPASPASAFDPLGEAKKAACKKACDAAEDKCGDKCDGANKAECKKGCKEASKKCGDKCEK